MPVKVKRCPICRAIEFHVGVTVSQTWKAGATGNLLYAITESDSVERRPTDDDEWTCAECGYAEKGSRFNLSDTPVDTTTILAKWFDDDAEEHVVPITVELFEKDVSPMAAIEASVKTWLKTPEGRLHTDESSTVTFGDLRKIPEEIFRQNDIRVTVQEQIETIVSYNKNLRERIIL